MGECCFGWAETNRGYRMVRLVWTLVMISRKKKESRLCSANSWVMLALESRE